MTETKITLRHLQELARTQKIPYYMSYYKSELAEKLGIKLPIIEHSRKKRAVEIYNDDGTSTKYPSILQAAKALKINRSHIYLLESRGKVKMDGTNDYINNVQTVVIKNS